MKNIRKLCTMQPATMMSKLRTHCIARHHRNEGLHRWGQMRDALKQNTEAKEDVRQRNCNNHRRMSAVSVNTASAESNVCSKQRDQDRETERQHDMLGSDAVKPVPPAGQKTKRHDANEEIKH